MDASAVRGVSAALFVDCFPLVLTDEVRTHHPIGGPCFRLLNAEASALAPGFDDRDELMTLASAWVDLSRGPVTVRLPPTGGRFASLTLIDAAGEPFASLGTRTGDDGGLALALVPPGWRGELPAGIRNCPAPGALVWLVSRIRARSARDFAETLALAKRQALAPLAPARTAAAPSVSMPAPPCPPCAQRALRVTPALFFHRLDAILGRAPAARQARLRPRIAALRAELDGPPPAADWTAAFAAALARGFAEAAERIRAVAAATETRGWRALGEGPRSPDGDSLGLASRALESLGAPLHEDIVTLVCDRDMAGRPLSGAERYRLRFPRGALPPVRGFWRLAEWPPTRERQPAGADAGADPVPQADGSLELVLQRAAPGSGQTRNWLQLPDGRFSLLMRLYAPAGDALGGAWRMPEPERIPAGARVLSHSLAAVSGAPPRGRQPHR